MSKVLDNKCPGCGAAIFFKPSLGKFKCDYCDSEYTAEQLKNMEELNKNQDNIQDYVNYNCPDCGASLVTDANTASTFCLYCGNVSIIKSRLSGEFAPSKLIPFKIEKEKAIEAFKKLKKGRPLVPKMFVSEKNIEKISGLYIPFWLYQVEVSGDIVCDCTKVKSWTRGNTRYTKTDFYRLERSGSMFYDRIPVDGSTRFNNDIMNTIEPFNYDLLVDYNHAYLSGFLAEKYDVDKETAFSDCEKRALNSTSDEMLNSMIGYTTKKISSNSLKTTLKSTEYVLLPVWMVNVKYNDKFYLFAMNGESGEFIGDIPLDKKKAVMIGIIVFIISFLISILISYLLFRMGGN